MTTIKAQMVSESFKDEHDINHLNKVKPIFSKTHIEAGLTEAGKDRFDNIMWIGTDKQWGEYKILETKLIEKRNQIEDVLDYHRGELSEWDEAKIEEEHYKLFQAEVV